MGNTFHCCNTDFHRLAHCNLVAYLVEYYNINSQSQATDYSDRLRSKQPDRGVPEYLFRRTVMPLWPFIYATPEKVYKNYYKLKFIGPILFLVW